MEAAHQNTATDTAGCAPPAVVDADTTGLLWYRRGRVYADTMGRAANAAANGKGEKTTELLARADEQLWPLAEATSESLRDFIAGINREIEAQVEAFLNEATTPR